MTPPRDQRKTTQTGVMPRVEPAGIAPQEPPTPSDLPEMLDLRGTTGQTPVVPSSPEGEDAAKDADDPTAAASRP